MEEIQSKRELAVDWRVRGYEVCKSSARIKQQIKQSFFQGAALWCFFHCQFLHYREAVNFVDVILWTEAAKWDSSMSFLQQTPSWEDIRRELPWEQGEMGKLWVCRQAPVVFLPPPESTSPCMMPRALSLSIYTSNDRKLMCAWECLCIHESFTCSKVLPVSVFRRKGIASHRYLGQPLSSLPSLGRLWSPEHAAGASVPNVIG